MPRAQYNKASALYQVTLQKAKLDEKNMEVEALNEDNSEMLQQVQGNTFAEKAFLPIPL